MHIIWKKLERKINTLSIYGFVHDNFMKVGNTAIELFIEHTKEGYITDICEQNVTGPL